MNAEKIAINKIVPNTGQIEGLPKNPRTIRGEKFDKLKASIQEDPQLMEARPLMVIERAGQYVTIGGNMRLDACRGLGWQEVPCVVLPLSTSTETLKRYIIKDNAAFGDWDWDLLADEWDSEQLADWGLDLPDDWQGENIGEGEGPNDIKERYNSLADIFGIFPSSIIDCRKGDILDRRKEWINMGLKSEVGRGDNLTFKKSAQSPIGYELKNELRKKLGREPNWDEVFKYAEDKGIKLLNGTSIFNPAVCELMYKWFCPIGGTIIDPFAGGSVRGIVAGKLGYVYNGIDIREEQITANIENANSILIGEQRKNVKWYCGDSNDILDSINGDFDMIFSCPPYADLEVYSDNPKDLSTMKYEQFIEVYRSIINKACAHLKNNRFAVFVVGDIRDKKGFYRGFIEHTIHAFEDCGLHLYNHIIQIDPLGSGAIRASKTMETRKVLKTHQNIIVMYKGDICSDIKSDFVDLRSSIKDIDIENNEY